MPFYLSLPTTSLFQTYKLCICRHKYYTSRYISGPQQRIGISYYFCLQTVFICGTGSVRFFNSSHQRKRWNMAGMDDISYCRNIISHSCNSIYEKGKQQKNKKHMTFYILYYMRMARYKMTASVNFLGSYPVSF